MSALGMTLTKKIAEDTWWKVKWSWDHKFLLGEETLTQLLVLDFVRFMPDYYKLHQCTKKEESQQGTDLEIRILRRRHSSRQVGSTSQEAISSQ